MQVGGDHDWSQKLTDHEINTMNKHSSWCRRSSWTDKSKQKPVEAWFSPKRFRKAGRPAGADLITVPFKCLCAKTNKLRGSNINTLALNSRHMMQ